MPWKKIGIALGILFIIWIFKDPASAGGFAKDVWNGGNDAADSVITFFSTFVS